MDPRTQAEKMEDATAPEERGFIDDNLSDEDARALLDDEGGDADESAED